MSKEKLTRDLVKVLFKDTKSYQDIDSMISELGLEIKSIHHGDTLCVQY